MVKVIKSSWLHVQLYIGQNTRCKDIKILVEKQNFQMKVLTLHHWKNVAGNGAAEVKSFRSLLMIGTFSLFSGYEFIEFFLGTTKNAYWRQI